MILLALLHCTGCLVLFSFLVDHYNIERGAQILLFALMAFGWPILLGIRIAQVAHREYRALRGQQ